MSDEDRNRALAEIEVLKQHPDRDEIVRTMWQGIPPDTPAHILERIDNDPVAFADAARQASEELQRKRKQEERRQLVADGGKRLQSALSSREKAAPRRHTVPTAAPPSRESVLLGNVARTGSLTDAAQYLDFINDRRKR